MARATQQDLTVDRKLAVARGLLPMSPEHLLLALYQLCHDPDEGVSRLARDTLTGLPEEMVLGTIAQIADPEPLDLFAQLFSASRNRMDALLRSKALADETVERLARTCIRDVADMIAANQQRLIRCPSIIEALYLNKNTRMSTVDRVITFAIRQGMVLDGIPAFKELAAAIAGETRQGIPAGSPVAIGREVDALFTDLSMMGEGADEGEHEKVELLGSPSAGAMTDDTVFDEFEDGSSQGGQHRDVFAEFDHDAVEEDRHGKETDETLSMHYQLSSLSTSQKIRLAMLGNASHRALLINDSNKLVAMAAIKSPGINDQEVQRYSTSRSVSEDIIRYIASKREWTRNYFIKVNLVNNPKTPLATAMQLLTYLRRNDLKSLAGNKNVPTGLTTAAHNMLKRFDKSSGG